MVQAFCVLLLCQLTGELLVRATGIPIPGPVVGLALLLGALAWRGTVPDGLRGVSRGLLTNLSVLFVPAGTGILVHLRRVGEQWPILAGTLFVSTALTITVTALVFLGMRRLMGADEGMEVPDAEGEGAP